MPRSGQFGRSREIQAEAWRAPLKQADSAIRIKPVPIPQAPLIKKAVNSRDGRQPPPMGWPLSGDTIKRATNVGRMAPKKNAVTQYPPPLGKRLSISPNKMPHTPPQNASEMTAGMPNG